MSNETQQLPDVFTFITDLPTKCRSVDQMKAVLKCRFQKDLDEYFDTHAVKLNNEENEAE
jgi:hypothetical protein